MVRAKILTAAIAAVLLAAPPALAANILSYNGPSAAISRDGRTFKIVVHPKQNLILIQSGFRHMTSTPHPQDWPAPVWRDVAESVVTPVGCEIPEVRALSRKGGTWEAVYTCPEAVDLRALVKAQKKTLEAGRPMAAQ